MLHEKASKRGTRDRGRYQVAQKLIERTLTSRCPPPSSYRFGMFHFHCILITYDCRNVNLENFDKLPDRNNYGCLSYIHQFHRNFYCLKDWILYAGGQ